MPSPFKEGVMQKKYWMLVALLVLALSVAAGIGVAEANRASRM